MVVTPVCGTLCSENKSRVEANTFHRTRECQQVVPVWRSSLHYRGLRHGAHHGARSWVPLLWPGASEVCPQHDVGMYGCWLCYHLSMVLLGLQLDVQPYGFERLHWQSGASWTERDTGESFSRVSANPCFVIRFLPSKSHHQQFF